MIEIGKVKSNDRNRIDKRIDGIVREWKLKGRKTENDKKRKGGNEVSKILRRSNRAITVLPLPLFRPSGIMTRSKVTSKINPRRHRHRRQYRCRGRPQLWRRRCRRCIIFLFLTLSYRNVFCFFSSVSSYCFWLNFSLCLNVSCFSSFSFPFLIIIIIISDSWIFILL